MQHHSKEQARPSLQVFICGTRVIAILRVKALNPMLDVKANAVKKCMVPCVLRLCGRQTAQNNIIGPGPEQSVSCRVASLRAMYLQTSLIAV